MGRDMNLHREHGFTLIELLIVVAIVGITAAIAAPELLRARMSGNEASAIATMRAIYSAQSTYASSCAHGGYAQSLEDLAKTSGPGNAAFVSPDIAVNGVTKSGYVVNLGPGTVASVVTAKASTCNAAADDAIASYYAEAHPSIVGSSGQRSFGVSQHGTIFQDTTGATFTSVFAANATPVQ
ncbi:MAG: pili assembly chaperone [Acidobacteria bacterium]|nr:MAG: pili assembly chaperone [Acidobacteriota bacterium]